jgi:hypothetical protein
MQLKNPFDCIQQIEKVPDECPSASIPNPYSRCILFLEAGLAADIILSAFHSTQPLETNSFFLAGV